MTNTWLIADPHFGHAGVCRFLREDGTKMRPFDDPETMDKVMIERWNERVDDRDRVYVLGDLAMNKRAMVKVLPHLKGRLVLIKGNHDILKLKEYTPFFDDIRAYHVLDGMIMSHIPIHPESLARFGANIHGHLHHRRVMQKVYCHDKTDVEKVPDPRYHCVSVEHTGYAPISFEAVKQRILTEGGQVGFRERREAAL